jgi:hypothetical protein
MKADDLSIALIRSRHSARVQAAVLQKTTEPVHRSSLKNPPGAAGAISQWPVSRMARVMGAEITKPINAFLTTVVACMISDPF